MQKPLHERIDLMIHDLTEDQGRDPGTALKAAELLREALPIVKVHEAGERTADIFDPNTGLFSETTVQGCAPVHRERRRNGWVSLDPDAVKAQHDALVQADHDATLGRRERDKLAAALTAMGWAPSSNHWLMQGRTHAEIAADLLTQAAPLLAILGRVGDVWTNLQPGATGALGGACTLYQVGWRANMPVEDARRMLAGRRLDLVDVELTHDRRYASEYMLGRGASAELANDIVLGRHRFDGPPVTDQPEPIETTLPDAAKMAPVDWAGFNSLVGNPPRQRLYPGGRGLGERDVVEAQFVGLEHVEGRAVLRFAVDMHASAPVPDVSISGTDLDALARVMRIDFGKAAPQSPD